MEGTPRPARGAPASDGDRLLALSIVLDGRLDERGRLATAALAARLGFGVWWREPPLAGQPAAGLAALLAGLAAAAHPGSAGLIADLTAPAAAAALAVPGQPGAGLRLALTGPPGRVAGMFATLPAAGRSLAVDYRAVAGHPGSQGQPLPPGAALLVPALAAGGPVAPAGPGAPVRAGAAGAGGAGRDGASPPGAVDLDGAVGAAVLAGRGATPPGTPLQVLAEVPVSIGRTTAEAHARARTEELFRRAGAPARLGLFGTLEECQHRAAELAHAGVTELACHLPYGPDTPDVLAQFRAVAVIGRQVLRPGAPPSPAPPPPDGWGGRRVAKADTG